ncbi:glycoprotein-N-acetylgalactosamine 3-beta-galactosyltransferase 1-like isoform X1 [Mizuhopecten yessoensis]|uniref:Glycoprotein-N-acetylgalactosamine 3-beta-galactosyltransferase 1 n=1 Tax=Mizuhopecten yessoensis TaxID=6573 RepID=A0A210PVZ3_MIZYE|nr:glycoprotein-N-acetylgalactosamine 3-beta-galactosyltransferase 1-like isoform X1 [Mizuhopecten yessoensis]OWF40668.1 Glycoprotein-N-acetylgalactosamine 3-beta-galactosyltransferase 1 [Mizuhopecten yessoensis]
MARGTLVLRVCGSSQTASVNFCFGLAIGLVIAFVVASLTSLQTPMLMAKYTGGIDKFRYTVSGGSDSNKSSPTNVVDGHEKIHQEEEKFHEQMDKNIGKVKQVNFDDSHFHKDNDKVAKDLEKKIRILCWVMTSPQNLDKKAIHVKRTWAKRCNVLVFISSTTNTSFPTVGLDVSEGREHLTAKTMKAFKYVYEKHFNDADWFVKADDDTYMILENLRYFLQSYSRDDPVYFGHHFKTIVKQGYYSGGAGYVLSKEALRRLIEKGQDPKVCRQDGGAEDAELGKCMENLGVKTANSTDALGRSRFHCFDPETHLFGGYPDWYYKYDANGAKKGTESISDYAISFHYVPPQKMYALEFYIYHLRPYGVDSGHQHLNVPGH